MKVVFMGTPDFSVPTLEALVDAGYEVAGVFTQPDRPRGRGGKVQMSPVKELALRLGIPVYQPLKIRVDGLEPLRALAPDVCVTAAFGQILSQEVLDVPRLGTVNVHASLLPRHRGAAPVQWAIFSGDEVTGVTTMFTDRGIDPVAVPGVICHSHGPFTWGKDAAQAVYHAVVLEEVAKMALLTRQVDSDAAPAPQYLQDKHYMRKHGPNAYYGQK